MPSQNLSALNISIQDSQKRRNTVFVKTNQNMQSVLNISNIEKPESKDVDLASEFDINSTI